MRRRGNKSSKVPNVKLRPADKGAYARPIEESCWAQDTQPQNEDNTAYDTCPRPMRGVVICATGVVDKPTLFRQAAELGATCSPAFTDRVTHLIAEGHGSAKYMCALERKIPIMKPSWITENYQIWLKGDDVDALQSVEQHRLPIFSGVVVCPSGITDITRRTHINKLVRQHEGTYLKDLERPVRVTHLLCSGDEETEKMRYAEKFNSRGEAKIHLVWEEWFWDSVDFGGRFDEATYQVRRPRPERKTMTEVAHSSPFPPSSTIPSQHGEPPSPSLHRNDNKNLNRKNVNNNSIDDLEDEPAFVNVLPDVTLQLWGGLLERRGYQINDGEVILSPSKVAGAAPKKTALPDPTSPVRQQFGAARSILSTFRRANSFAPAAPAKEPGASRQLPFRRTTTAVAAFSGAGAQAGPSREGNIAAGAGSSKSVAAPQAAQAASVAAQNVSRSASISGPRPQIFAGKTIRALGEAKGPVVRNAVEELGGRMSTDDDEDIDFIIVRLVSGSKLFKMEEDEMLRRKYRTDCWLEQCMYEDRICAPDDQISFVPLSVDLPVPGAEDILISISGFEQSESHGLKRLFRALGISLATTFSRHSTHLLCPSGMGLKFDKAKEWEVPVVNLQWVAAMALSGMVPQVHDFLVGDSFAPPRPRERQAETSRKDIKGKGKAVDRGDAPVDDADAMDVGPDSGMSDITNNNNARSLQREPTMLVSSSPEEKYIFGMPNHTLAGSSYIAHPSSIPTPTRSAIGGGTPGDRSLVDSFISDKGKDKAVDNDNDDDKSQETFDFSASIARRRRMAAGIDGDMARVPSSLSPSPMKAPMQRTTSRSSLSPVKIDHEATKALQDSITSLLGKRPLPESEESGAMAVIAGAAGVARNGKRARPQRAKTRQHLNGRLAGQAAEASTSKLPSKADLHPASGLNDGSINHFDASYTEDISSVGRSQDESMRVMYEDPGQREEKKRLINLLKGQSSVEESISTLSGSSDFEHKTRRSTRIAG